jgi:hypothetical protein
MRRTWHRVVGFGLAFTVLGAVIGSVIGLSTPAHVEIAGSDARISLKLGRSYDQLGVAGVLIGKRPTERRVLGERVGIEVRLTIDASVFVDADGNFNTDILPAYVQAYSDPDQLITDGRRALVGHTAWWAGGGAVLAAMVFAAALGYLRWRRTYDRRHWPASRTRAMARAYRAPERAFARRAAVAVVVFAVLYAVPSARWHPNRPVQLRADPALAGTPLADVEIDGLLRPAVIAVQDYIEKYFDQTNTYYDELKTDLLDQLAAAPVTLPGGDDVVSVGFVSDRHCNIGMDRVIVAALEDFHVTTLVSGGDDAFSGTFPFESACTRNLADKSEQAGITDVFVGGNHDSTATIAAEQDQGITTLTGRVETADGIGFIGSPDPRTSRYGQGIDPEGHAAQDAVVSRQGREVGAAACASTQDSLIAVLHDPLAGRTALQYGCGKIVLALDGHTHAQDGPNPIALPDGGTGYQFTSGSTGGAPKGGAVEGSFASRLTVGPLNHDAVLNIVTVDRGTHALVGVTEVHFAPDQAITVTQQAVS